MRLALLGTITLLATGFFSLVSVLGGLVRAPAGLHDWVHHSWSWWMLWAAGIEVDAEGVDHVRRDRAQVFMSNHQSNFDIFVLMRYLPVSIRFVAKKEISRIPLLAQAMRAAGHVFIDRADRRGAMEAMRAAGRRMEEDNLSLGLFPEGTRSRDGTLGEFKRGTFVLAIETQRPIVPVAVDGGHRVMQRGKRRVRPGRVRLRVGSPITTSGLTSEDREALLSTVRRAISDLLESNPVAGTGAASTGDQE